MNNISRKRKSCSAGDEEEDNGGFDPDFLDDESDESDEDDGDDETGEEEFEEILKAAESGDANSPFRSREDSK